MPLSYKKAGVDIDAGNEALNRIRQHVKSTYNRQVRGDLGSFGGLFAFPAGEYRKPVLVSSTDGVGTKLKVAIATGKHGTIGQDLVSHCINDILVQGAKPLFFLDYIGIGKMDPSIIEEIVSGLAAGCREGECVLIGGETAEMPGIYTPGEYDLVGAIVGVVEEEKILPSKEITPGDLLFGLTSSGLHTNGYTLARAILFEELQATVDTFYPQLGRTVGEELLAPHRCYAPILRPIIDRGLIKGLAHITGGGFIDNIPRILPGGCRAKIQKGSWPTFPIFQLLEEAGKLSEKEMFRTFNMGIGMVCVVSPTLREEFMEALNLAGEKAYEIGALEEGKPEVLLG